MTLHGTSRVLVLTTCDIVRNTGSNVNTSLSKQRVNRLILVRFAVLTSVVPVIKCTAAAMPVCLPFSSGDATRSVDGIA